MMANISQEIKDRLLKKVCSKCPSTKDLNLHHLDGDHDNNDDSNFETFCPSCHTKHHWENGKTHSKESKIDECFSFRLLESVDDDGYVWDVVLIEAGLSLNDHDWKSEILRDSLEQFNGAQAFAYEYSGGEHGHTFYDHLPETVRDRIPGGMALKNKVGDYSNIRYGQFKKPDGSTGEGILAQFKILKNAKWLRDYIKESGNKALGFSIDALTRWTEKIKTNGRKIKEVLQIGKVDEITLVSEPGAGGRLLRLLMSQEKTIKEAEMLEALLKKLKDVFPDQHKRVVESFKAEMKDDEKLAIVLTVFDKLHESNEGISKKLKTAELVIEEGKKPDEDDDKKKKVLESMTPEALQKFVNDAVESGLKEANTRSAQISQGKVILTTKLAESKGLPELEKEEILSEFGENGLDEAQINALLKRKQDKWAKMQESGLNIPDQERQVASVDQDEYDKLVCGFTGLLIEETVEKIPPFRTLHESYRRITGMDGNAQKMGVQIFNEIAFALPPEKLLMSSDTPHKDWTERLRESRANGSGRVQEAQLTTSLWTEVYGDSVRRALMKEYDRDPKLGQWREIVSDIGSAPDFRTNRRQRVGGFGNLSTVAEGGTYQELDFPTDDEVSYAVTKKGALVNLTMESVINDDLGAVRRIPRKLGVAAAQTLYEFVFDFLADNGAVDYDSVALFHNDHANLGTVALASTAFDDRVFAMNQQTEQDSGKPLGVDPAIIVFPAELRKVAWEITQSQTSVDGRTDTVDNWVKTFNLKAIQVNYWTDANNWYAIADPRLYPTIEIAFLNGRQEPELFIQDQPTIGSVFSADKITYKIRHIYGGDVLEHRSMDGNVVS